MATVALENGAFVSSERRSLAVSNFTGVESVMISYFDSLCLDN